MILYPTSRSLISILKEIDLEEFGLIDFDLPVEEVEGNCDEDEVPDVKDDLVTKKGDVWLLGDHRVMCGDSTVIDDVDKFMNGNVAEFWFYLAALPRPERLFRRIQFRHKALGAVFSCSMQAVRG